MYRERDWRCVEDAKRLVREGSPQPILTAANQEWAVDFAHDALANGRAIRVLTVEDEYTRDHWRCRWTRVLRPARDAGVGEDFGGAREAAGDPLRQRTKSPVGFLAWCVERGIELVHIQPGKPQQILISTIYLTIFKPTHKIPLYNKPTPKSGEGSHAGLPCLSRQRQWLQRSVSLEWQRPISPIQEMQIVTNARVRMIRGAVEFPSSFKFVVDGHW